MSPVRCKHPQVLDLDASVSKWPMLDLGYHLAASFPGVDPAQFAEEYAEACNRIMAVCGVRLIACASADSARLVATSGPIDGPYGVLAETELPTGEPEFVASQLFDDAETWMTSEQRIACMCHEICHWLGLGHTAEGSGNLMEPILSAIDRPQPNWDVPQLQERYGPPALPAPGRLVQAQVTITDLGTYQITVDLDSLKITFSKL